MTTRGRGSEMRQFRYRALTGGGRTSRGVIMAANVDSARGLLLATDLFPVELEAHRQPARETTDISAADIALGARLLADLLDSGMTLSRALAALNHVAPDSWRPHLPALIAAVRSGAGLSEALRGTETMPTLLASVVSAGEAGGGLPNALRSAAELYDFAATVRATLIAALTYPAFLLVTCLGTLVLMVGIVIPRFAELLGDLGVGMPASTALLLGIGHSVRAAGPIVLVALFAGCIAIWSWNRTLRGRERIHELLLRVPVIGELRLAWASASACATAAALLAAGVRLPAALEYGGLSCGDAALAARIDAARGDVVGGASLSAAIGERKALTLLCVQLIRAGEHMGELPRMLQRAASLEHARAIRQLQRAARVIEPSLVLCFGGVVAFAAAALLQAVYAVRPQP